MFSTNDSDCAYLTRMFRNQPKIEPEVFILKPPKLALQFKAFSLGFPFDCFAETPISR